MPKQNNASYNNCISQLHARYDGRGVKVGVQRDTAVQIKKENAEPNAYFVSRMGRNSVNENYRNGEYNGQKYMTTGDFLKYYNTRKERYCAPTVEIPKSETAQTKEFKRVAQQSAPVEQRQSVPQQQQSKFKTVARPAMKSSRFDPNADTIVLPSVKDQRGLRAKIGQMVKKWFPKEDKKENTTTFKRNVPVAAIGLIISGTLAMTMIIGSGVMASQANINVSDLKYEISTLSEEQAMLEEKLMKKENLSEIKEYATEQLGMISQDYVASEYISGSSENTVDDYTEKDGETVDFSTLLSAIFGK